MISPTTIDQINSLNIVDVIKNYTNIIKKGKEFEGNCPFHDEKTPSFKVSESKQSYHCFGCGAGGGGAINFVMEKTGQSFTDAIKEICQNHSIPLQYDNVDSEELKQKAEHNEQLYALNQAAARQYHKAIIDLDPKHPANAMIHNRWGGDHEALLSIVIQWRLGFAPDSWDFITKPIIEKALNAGALELGLIKLKNEKHFDNYRNRLMFPIEDHNGRIVGFGGRIVNDDQPKFLNSDDSPIYAKDGILYGLFHAKAAISKHGFAYLTEGYADVISFHKSGMPNTVASCGTSLTAKQAKLLHRYTKKVVIVYDGDAAGIKATLRALDVLLPLGFEVHSVTLPTGQDPDSITRQGIADLDAFLQQHQSDAVYFKANQLLAGVDNPIKRDEAFNDVARTISQIDAKVRRADYIRKIAKLYTLDVSTMRQLVDEQLKILERKQHKAKKVKKNAVITLNGNATQYPFFDEITDKNGNTTDIKINRVKFINLLSSFGFTRFEVNDDNNYTFVRLEENIISSVHRDEVIDYFEHFIENEYDFEGAGCSDEVDAEYVRNKFYNSMRSYFSKDLFARMRPEEPIIINEDDKTNTYFYYRNGFVQVNKNGWQLLPYEKMNGSAWKDQMLDRDFKPMTDLFDPNKEMDLPNWGVFADFVYRLSGAYRSETTDDAKEKAKFLERFISLMTIIGYIAHDFYGYKLKAILLTDSTLSDESDGRTGKTLLGQLIGQVRSYCEINGKDFDINDKNKYESATIGTQVVHLNDVKNKGRNKFDFEGVFNDVTEGLTVNAKFQMPFKIFSKMIISTNKTLNISGGSQRDRIIQFEVSDFFNENHSPLDEYGHWLIEDWNLDKDWQHQWPLYDNFICFCSCLFHRKGIINPSTINLELRVLLQHTCQEFIDFMNDIAHNLKTNGIPYDGYAMPSATDMFTKASEPGKVTITTFEFEKKQLYLKFKEDTEDYRHASWFTQAKFTQWLKTYAKNALGVSKPITRRSNGKDLMIFRNE